jgi:putative proteasome-type protease
MLREVFDSIDDPLWNGGQTDVPLLVNAARSLPFKKFSTPQEKLI